jgi:hypothetical protein
METNFISEIIIRYLWKENKLFELKVIPFKRINNQNDKTV